MVRIFTQFSTLLFAGALLVLQSNAASAQSGDPEAGKAKAAACVACHGQTGISPSPEFPHLAGQVPGYIAQQLALFKSGERANPIMQGMVGSMATPQDMADVDAFYASQTPNRGAIQPEQEEMALAGEKIYRGGYADHNIPACMGCHGPAGKGVPPNFPLVSGQQVKYLQEQLHAFKSGARKNAMMNPIAFSLSAEQIEQLAIYMSGLD